MKLSLTALGVALTLLGFAADRAMTAPALGAKAGAPAQDRPNGITKASRAAEHQVENALQGRSVARTATDLAITARIKTAMLGDRTVSASDINVDTLKGVVHLRGTVRSKAEAQQAVTIAKKTLGVKGVKSHLQVVPSAKTAGYQEKGKPGASGPKTR